MKYLLALFLAITIFTINIDVIDPSDASVSPQKPLDEEFIVKLIHTTSKEFNADYTLCLNIAWCESRLIPMAKNASSTASGIYQFIDSTFELYCKGDKLNPYDNIRCGVKLISLGKVQHWDSSYSCWKYLPYTKTTSNK